MPIDRKRAVLFLSTSLLWGCAAEPHLMRTETPRGATVMDRLRYESERSVEPFLSHAVQEAVQLGPAMGPDLVTDIRRHPDRSSLLALLVLKRLEKQQQPGSGSLDAQIQAAVLADALKSNVTYNSWGFPGRSRSEAVDAFVALGPDVATRSLLPLLTDARSAAHWGSADATLAAQEGLRVKDYAAWILSLATRLAYEHAPFPRVRDANIDMLRSLVIREP